jgi:PTH1 family peptidyl-tRNA hydrolase
MKLIIGIGNPGKEYKKTRHNVGVMVVDGLQKMKLPKDVVVKKSGVFMNESGSFVKGALSKYPSIPVSNLYIVHDDLDIPLGAYKIQFGLGPKDHNGVNSIEAELGTKDFWRMRIGIENRGNPTSHEATRGEEYVLQDFTKEERKMLDLTIKKLLIDLVSKIGT